MTVNFSRTSSCRQSNSFSPSNMLILSGIFLGIYIFLHGFLLNRSELTSISSKLPSVTYQYSHKRLILIIVDALSYEFAGFNSSYYQNINETFMPFISSLHSDHQAYIAQFIADPPTTTLQRLKALTTGSMPTFIDAGSNFGSTQLMEDNLLIQWKNAGRNLLFVGDDTWMHLYPNVFDEAHPYPSFNVKDLDTVDVAVRDYVLTTLARTKESSNWSVLVGHMLGVDHCGHTFGPNHPEMFRKLREVDGFTKEIVNLMHEDDLLVVFGDHGMTISGDHGGDSAPEVEAALIVYSKQGFPVASRSQKRMNQIDLVPSLAILTGIPIPYSNLGVLSSQLFNSKEIGRTGLIINFVQMINYTLEYGNRFSKISFPPTLSSLIYPLPEITPESLLALAHNLTDDQISTELHLLQLEFRDHWTRFDLKSMTIGGLLFLTSLILSFSCYLGFYRVGLTIFRIQCLLFVLSLLILGFWKLIYVLPVFFVFLIGAYSTIKSVGISTYRNDFGFSYVVFVTLLSLVYLSNSFLVNEFRISVFLLQSFLILKFSIRNMSDLESHSNSLKLSCLVGLMIIARLSLFLETCREESFVNSACRSTLDPLFVKSLTKLTSDELFQMASIRILSAVFLLSAYLFGVYSVLIKLRISDSSTLKWSLFRVLGLIIVLLFVCCWILDASQSSEAEVLFGKFSSNQLHLTRTWLARTLLLSLFPSVLILVKYAFSSINIPLNSVRFPDLISIFLSRAILYCLVVPSLFVLVFSNEWTILSLVGIALCIWAYTYLESHVQQASEHDRTDKSEILYIYLRRSCSWSTAVFACFLDNISFYSTGHQPTIAGIPWEAAFTVYSGDHDTQVLPAFMVLTNIFTGPIVTSCSLPLFILVPLYFVRFKLESLTSGQVKKMLQISMLAINCLIWRFFLTKCILMFGCVLSAGVLRRHLMVWKIFAPRLIFMGANIIVTGGFILLNRYFILHAIKPKPQDLIRESPKVMSKFTGALHNTCV